MFYEECTKKEILAYQELENEIFDFGEGPMKMEGTEGVYYKLALQVSQDIEDEAEYLNSLDTHQNQTRLAKRNITRQNKRKEKQKLKKLRKQGSWAVANMDTHLARRYRGKRSKYIKMMSNKKVRKSKNLLKGSDYRKAYNFWCELW